MKIHRRAEIGLFTSIAIASPAAGALFNVLPPTNVIWKLNSLQFMFVTSVAVADRLLRVDLFDGANTIGTIWSTFVHSAGVTRIYNLVDGFTGIPYSIGEYVQFPWRSEIWLNSSFYLQITALNIQAADQFSEIRGRAEAWIDD